LITLATFIHHQQLLTAAENAQINLRKINNNSNSHTWGCNDHFSRIFRRSCITYSFMYIATLLGE